MKKEKEIARTEYAERHEKKRLKALQAAIPPKPPPPIDDDRKLFVGKINFDDLQKLPKQPNPETMTRIKNMRITTLHTIFERFGAIEKTKDHILEKQHCFIIYQNKEDMQKAGRICEISLTIPGARSAEVVRREEEDFRGIPRNARSSSRKGRQTLHAESALLRSSSKLAFRSEEEEGGKPIVKSGKQETSGS